MARPPGGPRQISSIHAVVARFETNCGGWRRGRRRGALPSFSGSANLGLAIDVASELGPSLQPTPLTRPRRTAFPAGHVAGERRTSLWPAGPRAPGLRVPRTGATLRGLFRAGPRRRAAPWRGG